MNVKTIRLSGRRQVAEGTLECAFTRPADLEFVPGQHINIKLPVLIAEDAKGPRRTFTIASSPTEADLLIATRMTGSGFKKTLAQIEIDTSIEYLGPMGEFTLSEKVDRAVFIAGGIGITPFRSILLSLTPARAPESLILIYSNRSKASAAYHDLFTELERDNKIPFRYIPTLSDPSVSDVEGSGETRMVDLRFLRDHVELFSTSSYYLCGPPQMVVALTDTLRAAGIDAGNVRSESFFGY